MTFQLRIADSSVDFLFTLFIGFFFPPQMMREGLEHKAAPVDPEDMKLNDEELYAKYFRQAPFDNVVKDGSGALAYFRILFQLLRCFFFLSLLFCYYELSLCLHLLFCVIRFFAVSALRIFVHFALHDVKLRDVSLINACPFHLFYSSGPFRKGVHIRLSHYEYLGEGELDRTEWYQHRTVKAFVNIKELALSPAQETIFREMVGPRAHGDVLLLVVRDRPTIPENTHRVFQIVRELVSESERLASTLASAPLHEAELASARLRKADNTLTSIEVQK